ncbi:MAG: AAA family ATPase [Bacteroidetes bacterium]|nr:MAG: AAA family ATPase [Bacteroidota bacterium]
MQKYALGIQNFRELRKADYLYVDKTKLIKQLLDNKYYFYSHPRRFGKSLLISTLEEVFLGSQALFEGLWIHDKITWEQHPVLKFSFAKSDFKELGLNQYFLNLLDEHAKIHNIELAQTTVGGKMQALIQTLHDKHQKGVVLLIDEYDKPIVEYLRKDQIPQAEENREIMRQFYSPLKDLDACLRFVFITGVSKFSKVSIFSDLNNLKDITLSPPFATLLGYTEEEMEHYFHERIAQIAQENNQTYEQCFDKVRLWYNGYSWDGKHKVYNPTSILNFLYDGSFQNYWFETGTPTFLIEMLSQKFVYNMETIETSSKRLNEFRFEAIDDVTLLFQTGYLTIKEQEDGIYTLAYPNQEVRDSMTNYLLSEYTRQEDLKPLVRNIYRALQKRDFEKLMACLNSLFGEIPYQIFDAKQEKYYHAVIFLTFRLLGYYAQAEPSVGKGRIDAVVETADGIFIFEFKVNGTVQEAMAQIHKNKYYQRYTNSNKEICLLAVAFQNKEIAGYEIEKFEK